MPSKTKKELPKRARDDLSRGTASIRERIWTKINGFLFKELEPAKNPRKKVAKSRTVKKPTGENSIKKSKKATKRREAASIRERIWTKINGFLFKEPEPINKPTKTKKIKQKKEKRIAKKTPPKKPIRTAKKQIKGPVTKRITKKKSSLELVKSSENPVISPKAENGWEAWQTFNPGVILLDNKVHFLYRAVGEDGLSRLGYAVSSDGFKIDKRLPYPVYEHQPKQYQFTIYSYFSGGSWGGCEDPRIVRVDEEDVLYMTYTACDEGLRVGLTSIKVKDFLQKRWRWKTPKLISQPGEVHKNWVIFPDKINGKYAILHSINPEIAVAYVDSLEFADQKYIQSQHGGKPQMMPKNCWDNWIRGAGPPPLKTKYGWLVLYHAMDELDPGKYKVGAMLLDLNDPTRILHRSPEPILEPNELYENNGFKSGVVYASGAIVKDGKLLVYYGGADSCVCVAYANFEKFIKSLKKGTKIKLKKKKLKKKRIRKKK